MFVVYTGVINTERYKISRDAKISKSIANVLPIITIKNDPLRASSLNQLKKMQVWPTTIMSTVNSKIFKNFNSEKGYTILVIVREHSL